MAYLYKTVKRGGKTVLLHRYLMEQHLGRKLESHEVVHHINGDRWDNCIENLEVLGHQEHSAHHNQKYSLVSRCAICGAEFKPHPTKRARKKTCSEKCRQALMVRTRWSIPPVASDIIATLRVAA